LPAECESFTIGIDFIFWEGYVRQALKAPVGNKRVYEISKRKITIEILGA
jgi:hypothetical protein